MRIKRSSQEGNILIYRTFDVYKQKTQKTFPLSQLTKGLLINDVIKTKKIGDGQNVFCN